MANDTNQIFFEGRLGDDADTRSADPTPSVRFSVASNRYIPVTGEGGTQEFEQHTDWARCIAWGNAALSAARLALGRGDRVLVQGRWHSHHWTDGDGNARTGIEIVAQRVTLISRAGTHPDPLTTADDQDSDLWDDAEDSEHAVPMPVLPHRLATARPAAHDRRSTQTIAPHVVIPPTHTTTRTPAPTRISAPAVTSQRRSA